MLRRLEQEARRLAEASSRDHEEPQLRETAASAASVLAAAEWGLERGHRGSGASAGRAPPHRYRTDRARAAPHPARSPSQGCGRGACAARRGERKRYGAFGLKRRSCAASRVGRDARNRACRRRSGRRSGACKRGGRPRRCYSPQAARPGAPDRACHASEAAQAGGSAGLVPDRRSRCGSPPATSRPSAPALATISTPRARSSAPAHWRLTASDEVDPASPRRGRAA